MKFVEEDVLLRIYINEKEKFEGKILYEEILLKAKELKLAGATVLRGIMGYGARFHIHTAKIVDLSDNLPIVIEIIDREENINKILPYLDKAVEHGFVTMEKLNVIKYKHKI